MKGRELILYMPVIHSGYINFLRKHSGNIRKAHLLDEKFISELSEFEPSPASINTKDAKTLLNSLGLSEVSILSKEMITHIKKDTALLLVDDEVSRALADRYFYDHDIEWASVFLRHDSSTVKKEMPVKAIKSNIVFDMNMMAEAYKVSAKSPDWWRQVGAVLIKDEKVIIRSYNHGMPDDYVQYKLGNVRDFIKVGEKPELANTIHAEQDVIAKAARDGIALEGTALYVTHFPCPVCAKLIAISGISKCYFSEGSATLDGGDILKAARVIVKKVSL